MKILDIDMDYFLEKAPYFISQECTTRASDYYKPWDKDKIIDFIENNLGLSKSNKIKGKIICHHHEALYYWRDLINQKLLKTPFEVIHVDSHADLASFEIHQRTFIADELLGLPIHERINIENYKSYFKEPYMPGIGNYLLFAIGFRWISKLTYVSNPNERGDDYSRFIMKNFEESSKIIQLYHNPRCKIQKLSSIVGDINIFEKEYLSTSIPEPEVPFEVKKNINDVKYSGDFDFITFCISPNYTPKSSDFIVDIFREYIEII